MVKYVVPLVGSGKPEDPFRPKYDIDRKKYKCRYHFDVANRVAIVKAEKKIDALEDKEDVKKLE